MQLQVPLHTWMHFLWHFDYFIYWNHGWSEVWRRITATPLIANLHSHVHECTCVNSYALILYVLVWVLHASRPWPSWNLVTHIALRIPVLMWTWGNWNATACNCTELYAFVINFWILHVLIWWTLWGVKRDNGNAFNCRFTLAVPWVHLRQLVCIVTVRTRIDSPCTESLDELKSGNWYCTPHSGTDVNLREFKCNRMQLYELVCISHNFLIIRLSYAKPRMG